jgi:plastocyanin
MEQAAAPEDSPASPSSAAARALIPLGVGVLVALAIYVVATSITPDPQSGLFGTRGAGTFPLKSGLASGVLALAAFQLYTALWIFGKINRGRALPRRLGIVHRASGYSAIVLSLPIAYNCLLAYGFEDFDRRVLVHALAGCFFYGAFAAKIVVVRSKRLPGWTLPAAGGTLITIVVVLWYSAALWYYNDFNSPGLSPSAPAASKSAGGSGYGPAPAGGKGAAVAPVGGFVQVAYKRIAIAPDPIAVHVGQKIKWTNFDDTRHNVVAQADSSEKFTSPDLRKKGIYVYTPTKAGVIRYLCTYHPASMVGTITVVR